MRPASASRCSGLIADVRAHAGRVVFEHALHRVAVFEREIVVGPVHERRARQPPIELVDQLRTALGRADAGSVGVVERGVERLAGVVRPRVPGETEPDLDHAKLRRLEAGRRKQEIAKVQEVERRHRLQDFELLDQQLEDLVDAVEPVHDAAEILVLQHVAAEVDLDAVELVQNLLEPQFVGLVHDDEEHLIVRGPAVAYALRRLRRQELGQLQIVGIVEAACGGRSGHRGTFPMARPTAAGGTARPWL